MITLYDKLETDFQHNGIGSLDQNIIDPKIHWIDNGVFSFEFEYPLFAKHGLEITNSSIIKARDPEQDNLFFVYKVVPSMGYIKVYAYQMFYKLAFNTINDTNIVNKNGQGALTQMAGATQYPHKFKFTSDIASSANSRVVRKNPVEFLLDGNLDNSFINRWGGHIIRNGFNISINQKYGSNKGYTIRHKKDLIGYEAVIDESTVVTRIRPVGYDGLLLPEMFVDSPLINNYPEPRIQEYEYSDVKVGSDEGNFPSNELAYVELRRLVKLEYSQNKVDVPNGVYKIDFVNLKETEEYKNFAPLKQILPGDTVAVKHEEDGVNISAQMVEYNWNPLLKEYIDLTLGSYEKSFTSTVNKLDKIQTDLKDLNNQLELVYLSADGKNQIHTGETEPIIDQNSTVGDLWFKKNGDKTEMWILRKVNSALQWVIELSDATQEELRAELEAVIAQADADRTKAEQDFESAKQEAKQYTEAKAQEFDNQLLIVNQNVLTATNSANAAVLKADKAIEDAGFMRVDVDTAKVNAIEALTKAQSATDNVNSLSTSFDALTQTVGFKAERSQVNALSGVIDQHSNLIEANAQAITARLTSVQVDSLIAGKNYVNETTLNATATGLSSQITQVTTDLSNISVGGTNLATNTKNNGNISEKYGEFSVMRGVATSTGTVDTYSFRTPVLTELQYTVSFFAKASEAGTIMNHFYSPNTTTYAVTSTGQTSNSGDGGVRTNVTTEWKRYWITYTQSTSGAAKSVIIGRVSPSKDVFIAGVKFESGNKDSDWSPAIEDMATLEKVVTIEANIQGIQATVANKADQSQITQLAGQITSVVTDLSNLEIGGRNLLKNSQQINMWPNNVGLGSSVYMTDENTPYYRITGTSISTYGADGSDSSAIFSEKPIAGETYTISVDVRVPIANNVGFYGGQGLNNYVSKINEWVRIKYTYVHSLNKRVIGLTYSKTSIDYRNWKIEKGKIASDWSLAPEDTATQTQITQLTTDINLRATKAGLMAQINLNPEGILLQGRNIMLDGNVTMNQAFITKIDVLTLSAVYADIATIRNKMLITDSVTAGMIKADAGLFDKVFINDAVVQKLTVKSSFISSVKAIDITADKITGGTANFANFNAINFNANSITSGTVSGASSAWNLNTGLMNFTNPSTGDLLQLMQGEIRFQNGAQGRYLKYQSEGLLLQPFASNTGTSRNTALHLIGGGPGSYQYIQFVSQDLSGVNQRLEAEGQNMTVYHGTTGAFIVSKYRDATATGTVISGGYETRHPSGVSLRIAGDSIETPRDGARNIYLTPQGTGSVVSGAANGTRYTFVASDFVKQSTRKSKTNINPIKTSGLAVISRLQPVSYQKKDKVEQGIIETEIGFIAEDSLEVATPDGEGIYDSHITAYLVKAMQELGEKIKQLEEEK